MPKDHRPAGALQEFCLFALSRLVRWEAAALEAGGPARTLLEHQMASALAGELARVARDEGLERGAATGAGPRVAGWLRRRPQLDAAEAALLDLVLFDLDSAARKRLAGLMPDPPSDNPAAQLSLLHAAVSTHPGLWDGVALRGSVAGALAIALDLPAGSVPEAFVRELAREHRSFSIST